MALGLLSLGLVLLGALQAQAQDLLVSPIPAPPLVKIPLQPDFQEDQVRGLEGQLQGGASECEQSGERQSLRERVRAGWAQASAQPTLGSLDGRHTPHPRPHPNFADKRVT